MLVWAGPPAAIARGFIGSSRVSTEGAIRIARYQRIGTGPAADTVHKRPDRSAHRLSCPVD
jgi:hypothetical protein